VTIAIIIVLAAMTIMVSSWALDRDRSGTAATQIQGAMQITRSRAHRDGVPHGIRLIDNGNQFATTFQYIHSPPVITQSPLGRADPTRFVQFDYTLDAQNQVTNRRCRIVGLTPAQQAEVVVNAILQLPDFGTWHRITGVSGTDPMDLLLDDPPSYQHGWPDQYIAAATHIRTYNFGLFAPADVLVGEEVQQLPTNVAVDLRQAWSSPAGTGRDYDILFAPNGKLVVAGGQVPGGAMYLWVRDVTRVVPMPAVPDSRVLLQGGEQLLVVVKSQTGAMGVAPVDHGADPYALARKAVAGH
jgi:hypothetical protein